MKFIIGLVAGLIIGLNWNLSQEKINLEKINKEIQFNQSQQFIPPSYFKHKERNHLLKEKIYG